MGWFDALGSIGSGLISAGAGIYGAEKAADAAAKAGKTEYAQYLQSRKDFAPWLKSGQESVNKLRDIVLGGQSSEYLATPGYQFRFNEGQRALQNSASARGMIESGPQMKALMQYGQDIGTDEYNQRLNRLGMLAGYGQSAAGSVSNAGAQGAQGLAQGIANAGMIRGSSYPGAANVLQQAGGNAIRGWYY